MHLGWDRTSFLFYIGTPAALIGKFFGAAGVIAVILTVLFLYGAGRFHRRYERHINKKGKRKRSKKRTKRLLVTLW
jgi:high-affinity Fe2+/Pb2+ permease